MDTRGFGPHLGLALAPIDKYLQAIKTNFHIAVRGLHALVAVNADIDFVQALFRQGDSITYRNVIAVKSDGKVSEAARPLEKLAEDLRFSDPVSSEALTEIEDQLAECLAQLQEAVSAQKTEQILSVCQEAERILAERNQLCKLNKAK